MQSLDFFSLARLEIVFTLCEQSIEWDIMTLVSYQANNYCFTLKINENEVYVGCSATIFHGPVFDKTLYVLCNSLTFFISNEPVYDSNW